MEELRCSCVHVLAHRLPSAGRVLRIGGVHIDMYSCLRQSRRITLAVSGVAGALSREVFSPRRLCVLPDIRKRNVAGLRTRSASRKCASRGRWARVVCDPVNDFPSARVLTDILCRDHRGSTFWRRDTRTVNSRAESSRVYLIDPGINVGLLLGQHTAAFFLVEKNHGSLRKAFAASGCEGSFRVRSPERGRIDLLQLRIEPSVEQNQKTDPAALIVFRLPTHELPAARGGMFSQYPAKEKVRRSAARFSSPG